MKKSKKIFLFISTIFIIAAIVFLIDFSSRTTAPWKKKKNKSMIERKSKKQ